MWSRVVRDAGGLEFLKARSRVIARGQIMDSSSTRITICVHAVVLEAGGPESLKTEIARHRPSRAIAHRQLMD